MPLMASSRAWREEWRGSPPEFPPGPASVHEGQVQNRIEQAAGGRHQMTPPAQGQRGAGQDRRHRGRPRSHHLAQKGGIDEPQKLAVG